jgi:hypothetical protein
MIKFISAQSLAVPILPSQNASKVPFGVMTSAGILIDLYTESGSNTIELSSIGTPFIFRVL